MPELEEYQQRFVENIRALIRREWWQYRPRIRVLDMGCDCSGRQIAHLATLVHGEVVGINIPTEFPSESARSIAGPGTRLIRMDGTRLEFPDNSFDLVISANVMEHVGEPEKYVSEAARVLKPNGVAYFETAPSWTSARGHHVMECMVEENCPDETQFVDDGSVIPDWSHLRLDREAMRSQLVDRLQPATVEYILWYLYDSNDLNKAPWSRVRSLFETLFEHARISIWPLNDTDNSCCPTEGDEDYQVYGFSAVCRHQELSRLKGRMIRLARKLGV